MNKKAVIIYASKHHGNTLKLVKGISDKYDIRNIDATQNYVVSLEEYDVIGFASGIDFGKFYKEIEDFAKVNLPNNKQVFFLYTCANKREGFTNSMKAIALEKQSIILGEYGCRGYNTYGPWKIIGGMNKKHPTTDEIISAIEFIEKINII